MSLPDDENYPRTTTTSAQSFLSCETELHSVSTHTTGQKQTAIPLLHTEMGTSWGVCGRGKSLPPEPASQHQHGSGRAAPNRFRAALRAGESGGWPRGSAAKGPPPPPLPPRVRAQEGGEGRPGHGESVPSGGGAEGEKGEEEGEGSCVCLSRSLSEQNADRKCSGRNDSLHRRQTPATSPFPPLPPPRPNAPSLHQRRFRRCSWRGSLASPLPAEPPLRSSSLCCTTFSFSPLFFYFLPPPGLLVRGTRPKFMLKPPLRICEEGILLEKNTRFGVYFSVLPKHGGGGLQKSASQEADLERALKLNPQRRQPLEVGHSLELLSPLMPFLCGCERPRRRNRNTRCSKHCRGEGFPDGHTKREWLSKTGFLDEHRGKC
ncbi:uncharacterized protein LOC128941478 [Melozone crissalis]|uniref:uncharacterized protein LOC128941478 n=1 Tax=Melozone crissalis TaxID=40204 RepID=UPI0023DAD02C|nr:uncharacterized protein LOC128941478 [Melozone crissalis]